MKKTMTLLFAWMLTVSASAQSIFPNDELIVFFGQNMTEREMEDQASDWGMSIIDGPTPNFNATLLKFNDPPIFGPNGNPLDSINGVKEKAQSMSDVDGAGFNFDLINTTYNSGVSMNLSRRNCYDILDPVAQLNGGNNTVAAIFDTGISSSIPVGNGYFDPNDLGQNFVDPRLSPIDDHGHGSHMASIIMNNLENANSAVQLKAYKTHSSRGVGRLFGVIKALDFAVSDNVQVINMSFGYLYQSNHQAQVKTPLRIAIRKAREMAGILCVASAGNNNNDNDFTNQLSGLSAYPASFNEPSIISVASANCRHIKSSFSNYGAVSVDVFAPGENIQGRNHLWNQLPMSGTSQAAAFVTKLAIFLGTYQQQFDWYATKCAILHGVRTVPSVGLVQTDGHIVSSSALSFLLNAEDCSGFARIKGMDDPQVATKDDIELLAAGDMTAFELTADKDHQAEILISNIQGTILYHKTIPVRQGRFHYTLDFQKQAQTGIYFLSIKDENGIRCLKFVR